MYIFFILLFILLFHQIPYFGLIYQKVKHRLQQMLRAHILAGLAGRLFHCNVCWPVTWSVTACRRGTAARVVLKGLTIHLIWNVTWGLTQVSDHTSVQPVISPLLSAARWNLICARSMGYYRVMPTASAAPRSTYVRNAALHPPALTPTHYMS